MHRLGPATRVMRADARYARSLGVVVLVGKVRSVAPQRLTTHAQDGIPQRLEGPLDPYHDRGLLLSEPHHLLVHRLEVAVQAMESDDERRNA